MKAVSRPINFTLIAGLALAFAGETIVASVGKAEAAQTSRYRREVIKVPVQRDAPERPSETQWVERGSTPCLDVEGLAGAEISSISSIDLVYRGGARWRVNLRDACPALSYYQRFYLRPGNSKEICAARDVVHPRSGGECEISSIRRLRAKGSKGR